MTRAALLPLASAMLKAAALAGLVLALAAPSLLPPQGLPQIAYLLDVSDSMPAPDVATRWQQLLREQRGVAGNESSTLIFGATTAALASQAPSDLDAARARIDGTGTDIAAGLAAALAGMRSDAPGRIIVLSDGWADNEATRSALQLARNAGAVVHWLALSQSDPSPRIGRVSAPANVRVGQKILIATQLRATTQRRVRLVVSLGGEPDEETPVSTLGPAEATLLTGLTARTSGIRTLGLKLLDADSGALLDARPEAALIEVSGPPAALYVTHGPAPLLASLRGSGWSMQSVAPQDLDRLGDLNRYQLIVLDDIGTDDAAAPFWRKLEQAVTERGVGLIVLGGPRSFGGGGYRGSRLETLLPVSVERAKNEQRAAVLFAIDKSGSMDSAARGVNRLSYARAAALASLRALSASDRASVLAFDVGARSVLQFDAAPAIAAALESNWDLTPSGGTRLAPALIEAARQLANEQAARKLLVLVTDGFLSNEPLDEALAALRRARVELVTIAIGNDAQIDTLSALVKPLRGEVLRVGEAAELPRIMRAAVDARRAPIVSGPVSVRAINPAAFLPAAAPSWPDVLNYAVTRARTPAAAILVSASGEPVLAAHQLGSGRVVALPAGLGAWAPAWSRWSAWPRFAGALADWSSGGVANGTLTMSVQDAPGRLIVSLDATDGNVWTRADAPTLTIVDPDQRRMTPSVIRLGPGRFESVVPANTTGRFQLTVQLGDAMLRREHLRDPGPEAATTGVNPEIASWMRAGLARPWPASGFQAMLAPTRDDRPFAFGWLLAAWLSFLLAIVIDCRGVITGLASRWRRGGMA